MKLTIVIITYNHEKFIEECIKSVLRQNIPFEYEVLIGEDASTDKTADLLKKMMVSMPDNFHVFFRNKNMGMNANLLDLIYGARGEYLIILEGDDYWIDDNKVKKQIEFLEDNLDYVACSHKTLIVDEYSQPRQKVHIAEKKIYGDYTFNDFRMWKLPGQTTTILMRNVFFRHNEYKNLFIGSYPGDRSLAFILLINGKIKYTNERMSAYRLVTNKGCSFSSTNKIDNNFCRMHIKVLDRFSCFAKKVGLSKVNCDIVDQLFFRHLFRDWLRVNKCYPEKNFIDEYVKSDCKMKILLWILIIPFLSIKEMIENYYWKKD